MCQCLHRPWKSVRTALRFITVKLVKAFLSERPGRVHLERLPGYCLKLNPTELVWNQLKQRLKNQVFLTLEELTVIVLEPNELLEKDRKLV